jgi:hypothetical protein
LAACRAIIDASVSKTTRDADAIEMDKNGFASYLQKFSSVKPGSNKSIDIPKDSPEMVSVKIQLQLLTALILTVQHLTLVVPNQSVTIYREI